MPEERWKRVGMSGSLRGMRSEEMIQSNTSSPRGQKYLLSPRGMMAVIDSYRGMIVIDRLISGEGRMEREKESVVLSVREEQIEGAFVLRIESEELFSKMLTLT